MEELLALDEPQVTQVVWRGAVTHRHLALIIENEKFREKVSGKLLALGYENPEFVEISPVTETIEDLVVELQINAIRNGSRVRITVHMKMDGFELSIQ